MRRSFSGDVRGVALYRLYDDRDRLLYVGITNSVGARFKEHEATKEWWSEVWSSRWEWFATRAIALKAEKDAIWFEQPVYNRDRPYTSNESRWRNLADRNPRLQRLERQCREAADSGVRCIWSDVLYQLVDTVRGEELELARTRLEALLPEACACPECWDADRYGD